MPRSQDGESGVVIFALPRTRLRLFSRLRDRSHFVARADTCPGHFTFQTACHR